MRRVPRRAVFVLLLLCALPVLSQEYPFRGTIYNSDYNLYLTMNFYDAAVTIPNQEYLGSMAGYLGDYEDFRKWLIVAAQCDDMSATLTMINLEGSEDLRATLTYDGAGTYTLRQGSGSTIKIARQQKWVKLPKTLTFTTKKSTRGH